MIRHHPQEFGEKMSYDEAKKYLDNFMVHSSSSAPRNLPRPFSPALHSHLTQENYLTQSNVEMLWNVDGGYHALWFEYRDIFLKRYNKNYDFDRKQSRAPHSRGAPSAPRYN